MSGGQSHGRVHSDGSQRWLQDLVNHRHKYLSSLLRANSRSLARYTRNAPVWVSPLGEDDYWEYSDTNFLKRIGLPDLKTKLREFWPTGGPRWDALATVEGEDRSKGVIILEAKAKASELWGTDYACGAGGKSRELINKALDATKAALGVNRDADWTGEYYQSANRLAHLYFLKVVCRIPAWLALVYFVGGPHDYFLQSTKDLTERLTRIDNALGLPIDHRLRTSIIKVFPEVSRVTR